MHLAVSEAPSDFGGAIPRLDGQWLEMLARATEKLPFALIASDMFEPGAKIVCANEALERLTGYEREEVMGRNCRFLQGEETEQGAVQQLVEALREAQPVQVELTNYRKDGSRFRNMLSLQPVHDARGRYCYSIGVLADADALTDAIREANNRIISLLPRTFDEGAVEEESEARAEGRVAETKTYVHRC